VTTPTPAWLRALLARHKISQCAAARLLGVDPRSVRRWVAGDRKMSPFVAAALRDILGRNEETRR